jgi:4-hydroxyphenylacetate 3-monooxygenase
MRTGDDYIASLDDGRRVFLDGERIHEVATHPAFAGVVSTMAAMYDLARCHPDDVVDPETGHLGFFTVPTSWDRHELRRRSVETWSRWSHGFIGRGPDHVAGLFAGFVSRPELFDTDRHQLGTSVLGYAARAAEQGLWVTNSIVPPQMNPTDPTSRVTPVRLVEETVDGIVVDGAQMLGTGAAVADAIFVTSIRPLRDDEADRAVSFVVDTNAPGLSLVTRRPYATAGASFDYPLSTRFDETDSMVVFDKVLVPWDQVFAAGDVGVVNQQFFGTAAHQIGNLQSIIRLTEKLRFVAGVASLIVKANGRGGDPAVRAQLTELVTIQTVSEALTGAAHAHAYRDEFGVYRPAGQYLYAALGMQTDVYPRAVKILGELAGGGPIQVPSSVLDFDNAEIAGALDVVMGSDLWPARQRVKLFKLAWDLIGSEFAGRHVQYERFYSGAPAAVKAHAFNHYPFEDVEGIVESFLGTYS